MSATVASPCPTAGEPPGPCRAVPRSAPATTAQRGALLRAWTGSAPTALVLLVSLVLPSLAQRAARGWDSPSHVPSSAPHHRQRHLLIFLWSGDFRCVRGTKVKNRKVPGHQRNSSGSNPFSCLLKRETRQALHVIPSCRISILMVPRTPCPGGLWLHPTHLPQPLPPLHIQGMENSGYKSSNLNFAAKRGNAGWVSCLHSDSQCGHRGKAAEQDPKLSPCHPAITSKCHRMGCWGVPVRCPCPSPSAPDPPRHSPEEGCAAEPSQAQLSRRVTQAAAEAGDSTRQDISAEWPLCQPGLHQWHRAGDTAGLSLSLSPLTPPCVSTTSQQRPAHIPAV